MEPDFVMSDAFEEDDDEFDVEDYNIQDGSALAGERCGLCMDHVIDRGVLDCCQHWFCFACIDNWATITNLCPLCQNEFNSVACVPVYDTIGTKKVDGDSFTREEDWYVEGKNSSLSFPSYYIDENAVICLDGDKCKIRHRLGIIDEDSNLDTSIACDSCDQWYHAVCVGFDPDSTSQDTWLCPRCVVNDTQISDVFTLMASNQCKSTSANNECLVETALSGKVAVSVADAGETAVVVSMIGRDQCNKEPSGLFLPASEVVKDLQTQTSISVSDANGLNAEKPPMERNETQPISSVQDLELSLSHSKSSESPLSSLIIGKLETDSAQEKINEPKSSDETPICSRTLHNEDLVSVKSLESDVILGCRLGLSVNSFLSVEDKTTDGGEGQSIADQKQENCSKECLSIAEKMALDACKVATGTIGVKRRHIDGGSNGGETKANTETGVLQKNIKAKEVQVTPENEVNKAVSDGCTVKATSVDHKLKKPLDMSDDADIMSIVQETSHKLKRVTPSGFANNQEKEKVGLRMKKIVRRAGEDEESSTLVQKLRKEIKDAVRNRSTKDIGEHLVDPKLLAAFRTAVAGPKNETIEKLSPLAVKTKRSMLQRGKARENLTKKIYGTSNGKRKRAWDRDCEVEFWKHRCMRATKPEKIETLKSVLDLLRKNSEPSEFENDFGEPDKNPILSRLYLADTSVFPRKEDIKPLSAFNPARNCEFGREHGSVEKGLKGSNDNTTHTKAERKVGTHESHTLEVKNNSVANRKTACTMTQTIKCPVKQASSRMDSAVTKKKIPDDLRTDKRKWALEILARKNADASRSSAHENQEDNAIIRKNYPLLAQLPKDMLPVLAPSRDNKIPVSVRQVQLYRIAEHFLKKANLPVICRTAATELAVADAVNIEKVAADRSKSKLVYVNLCSQELFHRTDNIEPDETAQSSSSPAPADPIDRPEHSNDEFSTDHEAEEALREAGLLSDSPPNSPHHSIDVNKNLQDCGSNVNDTGGIRKDGQDNGSEMDSHSGLDICGGFKCNVGAEGYVGASNVNLSKLHEEDGRSELEPHLSTPNSQELENPKNSESTQLVVPKDSALLDCHTDADIRSSGMHSTTGKSIPSELSSVVGKDKQYVAENDELCASDKEPRANKSPDAIPSKSYRLVSPDTSYGRKDSGSNGNSVSDHSVKASELKSQNLAQNEAVNSSRVDVHSDYLEKGNCVQATVVLHNADVGMQSETKDGVHKKVETYIKEHIRPLCKSGVITTEQYRWAVTKTTNKVMQYHHKASNANFLIKEGDKVKKLAEQYVAAAQKKYSQ